MCTNPTHTYKKHMIKQVTAHVHTRADHHSAHLSVHKNNMQKPQKTTCADCTLHIH